MRSFSYTCGKLFILNLFEANGILRVLLIMNGNVGLSKFYKRIIYIAVCIYFLIFINRIKLKVDFANLTAGFFLFFLQANAKYTGVNIWTKVHVPVFSRLSNADIL